MENVKFDSDRTDSFQPETALEADIANALKDKYQFIKRLGRGATSVVYAVTNKSLDRIEALKVVLDDSIRANSFFERFIIEAKICASFAHPHIVTIYDYEKLNKFCFFSMFHVDGAPLTKYIKPPNQMPIDKICSNMATICDAIGYAHQRGVIHRDIKPSNIVLDKSGKPYVTDFGIAKCETSHTLTQSGALIGTPHYISPEQVEGLKIDSRADIYSLGVTLYVLLTHGYPFQGETLMSIISKRLSQAPIPPETYRADLPPRLKEILHKALQVNRSDRYQTTDELAMDLTDFVTSTKRTAQGGNTRMPKTRPAHVQPKRHWALSKWWWAAILIGIVPLFFILQNNDFATYTKVNLKRSESHAKPDANSISYPVKDLQVGGVQPTDHQLNQFMADIQRTYDAGDYSACIKTITLAHEKIDRLPGNQKHHYSEIKAKIDDYKLKARSAIDEKSRLLENVEKIKKEVVQGRLEHASGLIDTMQAQTGLSPDIQAALISQREAIKQKKDVQLHQKRKAQLNQLVVDIKQRFNASDYSGCLKAAARAKEKIERLPKDQKQRYSEIKETIHRYQLRAESAMKENQRQLRDLEKIKKRVAQGRFEEAAALIDTMWEQAGLSPGIIATLTAQRKIIKQKREVKLHPKQKAPQHNDMLNQIMVDIEEAFNAGDYHGCLEAIARSKAKVNRLPEDQKQQRLKIKETIHRYEIKAESAIKERQRQLADLEEIKKKVAEGHLDEAVGLIDTMLLQDGLLPDIDKLLRSQRKIIERIYGK